MGVRFPSVRTNTFIGPLPASNAETIVLTTPPLTISQDFADVYLLWQCSIVAGTTTSSFAYRIRRGTTVAGALISPTAWTFTTVAGNLVTNGGAYFDVPGAVAGQQYTLTVVQVGATGAGTFSDGALIAFSL